MPVVGAVRSSVVFPLPLPPRVPLGPAKYKVTPVPVKLPCPGEIKISSEYVGTGAHGHVVFDA